MQKDWSALRVTLLLYVIIAIFPFSFYFIHSSFDTLKKDGYHCECRTGRDDRPARRESPDPKLDPERIKPLE